MLAVARSANSRSSRSARAFLLSSALVLWSGDALAQTAPTSDPAVVPPPVSASVAGKRVFTPADFARFAPKNALDMLQQVPGFSIRGADQERGLGQASENVLLNGQRVPSKSGGAIAELQKISAASVERIEIVDAATLDIAGLSGQVANVVAKTKTSSGQFSWRPEFRAHYADPFYTRGDISYSGSRGSIDYTVGLNSGGGRSAAGGPTTIFNPDGSPREYRDDVWRGNSDNPKFSGRFTLNRAGAAVGNLNLAFTPSRFSYRETSRRERPEGVDRVATISDRIKGYEYEVGGDYTLGLAGGSLKLIGLRRFEDEPYTSSAFVDFADDSPRQGSRFERDGGSGEWIGRGEYSWKAGSNDFQIAGEAAFNKLKSTTRLFELGSDGEFEEILFPGGTGQVQEDRYEILGTWGRPLSDKLTMQLTAGGEYSKLASASDVGALERQFLRPKGSVSLALQASKDFDVSLKLRRRVGQLNFYDFLASVNLTDDRENAGNLNLVPPQSWEADLEFNRKLGAWGTTKLRLFGRLIDDIVDYVPIGETGQSPGNIDRAVRFGFDWRNTLLLDRLGWTGAKLDTTLVLQESRVEDPLTGEDRPISDTLIREIELSLRHDVPNTPWAWGGAVEHNWFTKAYRLTEVGRAWEGPFWANVFVEHKDVLGLTVRATAGNLLNARSKWDRTVYEGFRTTSPVAFTQKRDRLIGPVFSFSVRGNF